MKAKEVRTGARYVAKVNGRSVVVRVDAIRGTSTYRYDRRTGEAKSGGSAVRYDVTNLSTGRRTTFRSAAKFQREVTEEHLDAERTAAPLTAFEKYYGAS